MREEEEDGQRAGMKECVGEKTCGAERLVSISLEEMKSYYRYNQCCQLLQSEFYRDVCAYVR